MPAIALPVTRLTLQGQRAIVTVVNPTSYYDQFTTNAAAPLASPRTAEPGPGTWTVTDASSIVSIASSILTFSGTPAAVSGLIGTTAPTRKLGRAMLARITSLTFSANPRLGVISTGTISSAPTYGIDAGGAGSTFRVKTGSSATLTSVLPPGGLPYDLCIIQRSIGAYLLMRGGGSGAWTLMYVWRTGSADLFPMLAANNAAIAITIDDATMQELGDTSGASLNSDDYALASARAAVSTDGQTLTMAAADSIVQHTITAQTGVTQEIMVRRTDDSNAIIIRMDQTNSTCAIIEKNAGVEVSKASAAKTWTNGTAYRVVVRCTGSNIRVVIDDGTEINTGTSAFNTGVTGARVSHAGIDFICWLASLTLTPPAP